MPLRERLNIALACRVLLEGRPRFARGLSSRDHLIEVMLRRPLAPKIPGCMGFLRDDDQPGATRYRMREKLFAIGDDFWIDTEDGRHSFKVNGKAMRIRDTFVLEGPSGDELFKAQEKKLRVRDTMKIEHDGETAATIKKAMITPLRERFTVDVEGGGDLNATGNVVDHEYKIERDGHKIAEISKRWFRFRDTYGIEIAAGENDALILAITACIDRMAERR